MKSLEDLNRIREQAKKNLEIRQKANRTQIKVYMGTCGIAAGARETINSIIEELGKFDISNVEVTQKGCIGLCEQEPIVEVSTSDGKSTLYGCIDSTKGKKIVQKHIVKNEVIDEWTINRE
jgi:(2Fe-2S) ferredoxin